MTPARTAEGHTGRRLPRIDIDLPPLIQRVRLDIAAHPGSLSRDVAGRLGVSLVQASRTLGILRDRHHEVYSVTVPGGGYRWALVGVLFDAAPRPMSEAERAAPKRAGGLQRERARARRATVAALLDRPRSKRWICARTGLTPRAVKHVLRSLIRAGVVRPAYDAEGWARYALTPSAACNTGGE